MAALLRFHYKVDPDTLDDEAYWQLWHDYLFVRHDAREQHLSVLRQVVGEAFPPAQ